MRRRHSWRGGRVRFVRQATLADCGLACVAMIASAYGCNISLRELSKRFAPGSRGTSVLQVLDIARTLGFEAEGVSFELESLHEVDLPAILHWRHSHFVVLQDMRANHVTVLDPATGQRKYRIDELRGLATGIAVEMRPTERIQEQPVESPSASWRPLIQELRGLRSELLTVLLSSLYLEAVVVAVPLLLAWLFDLFGGGTQVASHLTLITVALIAATITTWALGVCRSVYLNHLSGQLKLRFIARLIPRLLGMPYSFFEERSIADLMYRLTGIENLRTVLSEESVKTVADAFMSIIMLGAIVVLNPMAGLVTLIGVSALVGIQMLLSRGEAIRLDDINHARGTESGFVQETLASAHSIKLFGRELERALLWRRRVQKTLRVESDRAVRTMVSNVLPLVVSDLVVVGTLLYEVVYGVGSTAIGIPFAIYVYQKMVFDRARLLASRSVQFRMAELALGRLGDVLQSADGDASYTDVPYSGAATAALGLQRVGCQVKEVSYRFSSNDPWLLYRVSVRIAPGEFVAITGRSGVGKSTLIELMLGMRQPDSGSMHWYGVANEPLPPAVLRRAVACVTQEDIPMMGTVEENITFSAEFPDLERMRRAAALAELEGEIVSMPLQYRTQVGPRGCNLSGGQRQRLLLARALYAEARTLVIDEGTSEIDSATEATIYRNLRRNGLTLIVVAHRHETLRLADRTVRLDNGTLVEDGRWTSPVAVPLPTASGDSEPYVSVSKT